MTRLCRNGLHEIDPNYRGPDGRRCLQCHLARKSRNNARRVESGIHGVATKRWAKEHPEQAKESVRRATKKYQAQPHIKAERALRRLWYIDLRVRY